MGAVLGLVDVGEVTDVVADEIVVESELLTDVLNADDVDALEVCEVLDDEEDTTGGSPGIESGPGV